MRTFLQPIVTLSVLVLGTAAGGAASADEPPGVKLLRPDSLVGWDYGHPGPSGWRIADGRLSADAGATALLSGFSFGDLELHFAWSVGQEGCLEVHLPAVPRGEAIRVALGEGDGCGRIVLGDRELAAGKKLEPTGDGAHSAALKRQGGKLALWIDGKPWTEAEIPADARRGLAVAVPRGEATLWELRAAEPPGEPIFNGRDFAGWWTPGNIANWTYEEDGTVRMERAGNYLRSEKLYANFTLSLEFQMRKGNNSGLGLRTPPGGWPSSDGMELQWQDRNNDRPNVHDNMAIYGNVAPLATNIRSEEWNALVVKADGWMISAWLNGELVQHYNTHDHPELRHRNLDGWIGFQDHGGWIRLRKATILEAPEGTGLDAWRKRDERRAGALMIERATNPEFVARPDGLQSGVAAVAAAEGEQGEYVAAELTGPGAVVRIARSADHGRAVFFFDGEEKPRIECRLENLRGALPQLSEDDSPVVTCLLFEKSLKIVLREAGGNQLRFDHVTFPGDYRIESFRDRESGFPPSWPAAAIYRLQKFRWGATRQFEPLPLAVSEKKTIPPGGREELLSVEGAGLVRRMKLLADKRLLDHHDLWLEVTVDGEPQPAVAAPARFWFPGVAGQGRYSNYVLSDQGGGVATMLAMPFDGGIQVAAVNRSEAPISGVGVELLVQPAGDGPGEDVPPTRLRGRFLPKGERPEALVRCEGKGRWIGLVCQFDAEAAEPAVESLVVDGVPVDGWAAPSLDLFLGRPGDFRSCLSGRNGSLTWRYMLLAPVEFRKSLVLKATGDMTCDRLVLYYAEKKGE
jgi:hypothetical protein